MRLVSDSEPKSFQFHAREHMSVTPYMAMAIRTHGRMKLVIRFTNAKAYAFLGTFDIGRDGFAEYRENQSYRLCRESSKKIYV